jgi:hypothetical chaperone protein
VVLGRPVHFVDDDPARDARAQQALTQAAHAAGFEQVRLELEPIAAAFDYEQRVDRETLALIVDIGGGTSDFTIVRLGPERTRIADRTRDILATRGVHIGGTDYDRRLSLARVMPLLGLGHHGPNGREVPSRVFFDLSTWHLINWLYTPKAMQDARGLRTSYTDPHLHRRLLHVLAHHLGHRVASEVELAKICGSSRAEGTAIELSCIEDGLAAPLPAAGLAEDLDALLAQVVACARECVTAAGLAPGDLHSVYLTGGSSALPPFQQKLREAFPDAELVVGDLFGGVASGLAYAGLRA